MPVGLSLPPVSLRMTGLASYDFDFANVGVDDAASLALGGEECLVSVAADYWMLHQIKELLPWTTSPTGGQVTVPVALLAICASYAYQLDPATRAWLALDCLVHPTTLAYTFAHAYELGFALDDNGDPKAWVTTLGFARDLGAFANLQRLGGDPSPWTIYPGDVVDIPNAPTAQPHHWI